MGKGALPSQAGVGGACTVRMRMWPLQVPAPLSLVPTGHPRTADHTHTAGNGQATPNAPGLQLRSSWQPRAGLPGSCRGRACAWILPALRRRRFNIKPNAIIKWILAMVQWIWLEMG